MIRRRRRMRIEANKRSAETAQLKAEAEAMIEKIKAVELVQTIGEEIREEKSFLDVTLEAMTQAAELEKIEEALVVEEILEKPIPKPKVVRKPTARKRIVKKTPRKKIVKEEK